MDSDNRAEFLNNIRSEQYQNQLQLINNDRKGARVTVDIDKNLDQFYDIIHGVCKPLLGRYPLSVIAKERSIKFWTKIMKSDSSSIHNIYLDLCNHSL